MTTTGSPKPVPFEPGSAKDRILKALKTGALTAGQIALRANYGGTYLEAALLGLMRDGYVRRTGGLYELAARKEGVSTLQTPGTLPRIGIGEKFCPSCGVVKKVEEFNKNRTAPDGLQGYCKLCSRAASKNARANARKRQQQAPEPQVESNPEKPAAPDASIVTAELPAKDVSREAVRVLNIPHDLGLYVRVEGDRVYISQPLCDHVDRSININARRALELGRWLVDNLGAST